MNIRLVVAPLLLLVAGCDRTESDIKQAVRERLFDPASAIFGEVHISRNGNQACVAFNSKNQVGGYTGEQEALVERSQDGRWSLTRDAEVGCTANMRSAEGLDDMLEHVNRSMEEVQARSDSLNAAR